MKAFFSIVAISTVSLTYNNCAVKNFESQGAIGFSNASIVPIEQGEPSNVKTCIGEFPAQAAMCYGDDQGLLQNTNRTLGTNCTNNRKCEFVCNAGYNLVNGVCVLPQVIACASPDPCVNGVNCSLSTGMPSQISQPWVKNEVNCGFNCNEGFEGDFCERASTPVYSCQGNAPSFAVLCGGDDLNLTANVERTVKNSCGSAKCEYTCLPGYNNSNGSCVPVMGNSCAAAIPCSVGTKCTTITGSPSVNNQSWVKNASNCGFTCTENYEGDFCERAIPPVYSCQGNAPANSVICSGDDQNLTANLSRMTVGQCTSNRKCEHVCESGFNLQNGACV